MKAKLAFSFWSFVSLHITHRPHPSVYCDGLFCVSRYGNITYYPGCRKAIVTYPEIRGNKKIGLRITGMHLDGSKCSPPVSSMVIMVKEN